uniref:Uncharacterized protein n=1 Tax=Arundo donax TaxID=35708 RepID=A0A0A9FI56_ARUDO
MNTGGYSKGTRGRRRHPNPGRAHRGRDLGAPPAGKEDSGGSGSPEGKELRRRRVSGGEGTRRSRGSRVSGGGGTPTPTSSSGSRSGVLPARKEDGCGGSPVAGNTSGGGSPAGKAQGGGPSCGRRLFRRVAEKELPLLLLFERERGERWVRER